MIRLDDIKEWFRPKLEIDQDQVIREAGYEDPDRVQWLLDYMVLVEGGFDALKESRPPISPDRNLVYFARNMPGKRRQHKRVKVYMSGRSLIDEDKKLAERRLKLALHERRANAGIWYTIQQKDDMLIASAVPAVLDEPL